MSEVTIALASGDEVLEVQSRRKCDEATVKLALEAAELGCAWVARDQSESIGLSLAHFSDEERFVGDVFVEPSYRGQGIGGELLDAALSDSGDLTQTVILDGSEIAGLALALRRRLAPREVVLRVAGAIPGEDELLAMAAGDYRFEVGAIEPAAHSFGLDALDRETRGITRPADHRAFEYVASGQGFFLNGEMVAYAYVWPDGRIGPLVTASAAYLVQIFSYALVTLQRTFGASWCTALVPGSNVRIARAALRAGLQIVEVTTLASNAPTTDLSRYVGFHQLLF